MSLANHNCWAKIAGDTLVLDGYPLPLSHRELGPRDLMEICMLSRLPAVTAADWRRDAGNPRQLTPRNEVPGLDLSEVLSDWRLTRKPVRRRAMAQDDP